MESYINTIIRQLVPSNILESFSIESIDDSKPDLLIICLVEKECLFPVEGDLVLNGFMNVVELTHFPLNGRQSLLQLKRRRWKFRGETQSLFNSYEYTVEGTKVTKEFGAFLKEIDRDLALRNKRNL
jgi:hypothetical protein